MKYRCTGCKAYVLKDELFSFGSLSNVCSEQCLEEVRRRQPKSSRRRRRPPKNDLSPRIREDVLRRDRHRCKWCGIRQNLHVHHVRYRSEGGSDDPINLITLCVSHHEMVHSNKRRYQALCLAAVSSPLTLPQIERRLNGNA